MERAAAAGRRFNDVMTRGYERLEDQVELFRRYYNFVRPHRALKFGKERRTPAMQAGLVSRKLTFRDIFTWPLTGSLLVPVVVDCSEESCRMEQVRNAA